jgi:hypothetical protein
MAPYRYAPVTNPYANASIGELLLRQGDIAARRAQSVADAEARASQASGNAWSSAIQSIGQTVGSLPLQIQQEKQQAARNELGQLQLDETRRSNRSRNIFEAELQNPANYNQDGTVNDTAISERLKKQDVGAWQQWSTISAANAKNAIDMRAKVAEINKTEMETAEKQRAYGQTQRDYLGKLAYNAENLLKQQPDDPLHARDTALASIARAAADGAISPDQARQVTMGLAQASPQQIGATLGQLVPPELRSKLEKEAADTAKLKADTTKTQAEIAGTLPLTPAQVETQRHNKAMEDISRMTAGRADAALAETRRHNQATEENARNTKVGRPVIAGDAEDLANFDTSRDELKELRDAITAKGATGIGASIAAKTPFVTQITGWGADAKAKQALIDRVKQVIGKSLEGGVLRKEDEAKYEKILPTIGDANEVVISKIEGLDKALADRKGRRLDSLEDAGFNVSKFKNREAGLPNDGETRSVNGSTVKWMANGPQGPGWYK